MAAVTPEPGDFAVVSAGGLAGRAVAFGEWLNGDAFTQYEHAFVYVGGGRIIQAEPGGANEAPLTGHASILWSSGVIPLTDPQRKAVCDAARGYVGVPYSFLDYAALVAHRLRLPVPGLRGFIATTRHQICSQLVDQCYADAGVHLFKDGRWPGYVTPAALAHLLT
jgi:cell wall-associated NlpC family hydrolase